MAGKSCTRFLYSKARSFSALRGWLFLCDSAQRFVFTAHLKGQEKAIQFILEMEVNNRLPFLDVFVSIGDGAHTLAAT